MWSAFLLTLALSADGLLVGLSYGARGISIPGRSLAVIALCTGVGMSISMITGQLTAQIVPGWLSHSAGGAVLVLLGVWQLWQGWVNSAGKHDQLVGAPRVLARVRFRLLGIVVEILRDPDAADQDASGCIDPGEAVALGIVLGLDTLAAGFAASLAGLGPWLILLVTGGLLAFTWSGLAIGRKSAHLNMSATGALIPALMLILVGLWELR